jgi:hypothetical protein
MRRSYPVAAFAAAVLCLAITAGCSDDPAAPEASSWTSEIAPPQADAARDPFVGLLIASLEDPATARFAQDWLDAAKRSSRRHGPLEGNRLPVWDLKPTTPGDLITLDALRLVLGAEPAETESTTQKERER